MLRIYPPRPAKSWAAFSIDSYDSYEKHGKYGDEKQERFAFVPAELSDAALKATVDRLQPGDKVKLSWRHEYVTRSAWSQRIGQRTSSSFPERPVVCSSQYREFTHP